jgi:hypothetical protein
MTEAGVLGLSRGLISLSYGKRTLSTGVLTLMASIIIVSVFLSPGSFAISTTLKMWTRFIPLGIYKQLLLSSLFLFWMITLLGTALLYLSKLYIIIKLDRYEADIWPGALKQYYFLLFGSFLFTLTLYLLIMLS